MSIHATNAFVNYWVDWFKAYAATKGNQTSGDQKTQIVSPAGTAVTVTGTAIDTNVVGAVSVEQPSGAKLHTIVDQGSIDATVSQSTGSNLHTVVDSGSLTVVQSTASNLKVDLSGTGANTTAIKVDGSAVSQPVIQDALALPNNSSTANINSGATWTGTAWDDTLGVNGIQVNIVADQNCTVYVDQSMDGLTSHITDSFKYVASKGGNSWTVQATASHVRVRVTNTSPTNTTSLIVQTVLCPIVDPLPRALAADGCLRVDVGEIESNGFLAPSLVTPTRSLKTTTSTRLIGASFSGAALDAAYWASSLGTGGTVTVASGEAVLSTGAAAANNATSVASVRTARYVASNPNYFRAVIVLPAVTTASGGNVNTRRWGAFDTNDGYYFEAVQTNPGTSPVLQLRSRKATVDSAAVTAFNGDLGYPVALDTNVHTYEIYWTNSAAWFFVDNEFLHKMTAPTATLTGTPHLKIGLSTTNSGGTQAANTLTCRVASICRLGLLTTQPTWLYQSGTTAGVSAKVGPGNLHRIIVGSQASTSVVTLYDNTSALAPVIFAFTYTQGPQANNQPFSLDFGGLPFYTGLFLVIATANSNVTLVYE